MSEQGMRLEATPQHSKAQRSTAWRSAAVTAQRSGLTCTTFSTSIGLSTTHLQRECETNEQGISRRFAGAYSWQRAAPFLTLPTQPPARERLQHDGAQDGKPGGVHMMHRVQQEADQHHARHVGCGVRGRREGSRAAVIASFLGTQRRERRYCGNTCIGQAC